MIDSDLAKGVTDTIGPVQYQVCHWSYMDVDVNR